MRMDRPELEWTPEMVAHFWGYESNFPERFFTFRNGAEIVRQLQRHFRGKASILDYGCGPGYLLDELLAAGIEAAGLDFSPEALQKVNQRFQGHPHFLGTFTPETLAESGRRFDAICVVEVIEHLYDEPLNKLLVDLAQFLAPDGVVVFTTPNEEDLEKSTLLCPVMGQVFHRWQHVRSWSQENLQRYLEARGYQVLECFTTNFRSGPSKAKKKGGMDRWLAAVKRAVAPPRDKKEKAPHLVAIAQLAVRPNP